MTAQSTIKSQNGDEKPQPRKNETDQFIEISESTGVTDILEQVNAGTGNYDEGKAHIQEGAFIDGDITNTLVGPVLLRRSFRCAKKWLAENGTRYYDETDMNPRDFEPFDSAVESGDIEVGKYESTWTAEERYANKIWRSFDQADVIVTEEQHAAIVKATGRYPGEYTPLPWKVFAARHDISRSLRAKLLEMILGDHYTFSGDQEDTNRAKGGVLRGRL